MTQPPEAQARLVETASRLVAPPKGILAADESSGTIAKRLAAVGVESTSDTRASWRELVFSTAGIEQHVSGVILFDETMHQRGRDQQPLPELLRQRGILVGIKVDAGKHALAGSESEFVTEGLDGLSARLEAYREQGAVFTKWRGVIRIALGLPSSYCVAVNAHALARFAAVSQAAGLVPIVEPEVLMDGDHDIERCLEVTRVVHEHVYRELFEQRVLLEGTLLKSNMVLSGKAATARASSAQVAEATLRCLRRSVPAAVPGVVFLSGGQGDDEATENLSAINSLANARGAPWQLSFSYGRGLQSAALATWRGDPERYRQAQEVLLGRVRATGAARMGEYSRQ